MSPDGLPYGGLVAPPGHAMSDVVVVGNAGIDTLVYLAGPPDLSHETDYTENLDTVGQAGGYSARGFARLGWRTTFLGYVGDDPPGRWLVEELSGDGVDLDHVAVDPAGTNRSVNLMTPDGRRHGFFDGKGHMTVQPPVDRWAPVVAGARLVHASIPHWARQLLPVAHAAGVPVSVDLQDVRDVDDPYRRDFVAAADVLFCSATHLGDVDAAIAALLAAGRAGLVACGMGGDGVAVGVRGEAVRRYPPVDLPAPVVDTTGAGDSLAVGLLSALVLEGRSLDEAVTQGQRCARWCCTLRGTSRGLATRADLDAWPPTP